MTGRREVEFRARLIAALMVAGAMAFPVESRATGRGYPDVVVVRAKGCLMLELKDVVGCSLPELRPSQRAFSRRAARYGQLYLVAARHRLGTHESYAVVDPKSGGFQLIKSLDALAKFLEGVERSSFD